MSRSLLVVLGIAVVSTAASARAEDFWYQLGEAIGQAIVDEAASDGNNGNWNNNNKWNNNNNGNWNNGNNWNNNHNHNNWNNNYQPVRPNSQYQKIWNGTNWEYVTPAPAVVYPSTTVVSPATTVTVSPVVQNALPYKGPGVTIALEEDEGGAVTYTVDGKESATIQAGQQQTLTSKGKYEILFSRGKSPEGRDFGQARYTITEGNYHFKVTDKGWELLRDKNQPGLVTTQIQAASPSGIKTNTLPSKSATPDAPAQPAPPAAASPVPAAPAAAAPVPAAPVPNTLPAAKAAAAVPPPPAAPAAGS